VAQKDVPGQCPVVKREEDASNAGEQPSLKGSNPIGEKEEQHETRIAAQYLGRAQRQSS